MCKILHVDDNEGDIMLTKEALKITSISPEFEVAYDGEQGFEKLEQSTILPDIILLDINMPKVDGKQFLELVKNNPRYKKIPVIMLTTSADEKDINDCYELHANAFLTKTYDFESYLVTMNKLVDFWLKENKKPVFD